MSRSTRATAPLVLSLALALLLGGCGSTAAPGPAAGSDAATGAASNESAPVLLRWSWNEGDTIRYRHTSETDSIVASSMVPEPITTTGSQIAELTQEVTEVAEDGVATVRMTYDRLDVTMRGPTGEEMTWSSDDPVKESAEEGAGESDPMAQMSGIMGSLVGQDLTLRFDERGELLAVEGFEALYESMAASLGDDETAAAVRGMMEGMFSEETLRKMIGQGMVSFPADPVAPGDTWTRDASYSLPMVGGMALSQTYRFERLDGDLAVLTLDGSLEAGEEGADMDALPLPPELAESLDFDLEVHRGHFDGTIRFDRASGQLARHEMTADIEMTLTMTAKDEETRRMIPEPLVMEMTSDVRTVYERIGGE